MFGKGGPDPILCLTKQLEAKPVDILFNFMDGYLFLWTIEFQKVPILFFGRTAANGFCPLNMLFLRIGILSL